HVDVVLYGILHRLTPIDLEYIRRLERVVTVVPVILKSDSLTSAEVFKLKREVLERLGAAGVRIHGFGLSHEECVSLARGEVWGAVPFAISSPNEIPGGEVTGGRETSRNEFEDLKTTILYHHINDIRTLTAEKFANCMAKYDLTRKIGEHLDRHMVLPLLEFLTLKDIYKKEDLLNAKFELLSETNMIDFANQIYQQIHDTEEENLPDFENKRNAVLQKYARLQEEASGIMAIITDPNVIQQLKQDKLANVQFLEEKFNFKPEMLRTLYEFSRVEYSVGDYSGAADMLYHFRIL
ncbi:eukaryotic translation initiation factor 3 subunit E, partial [Phlyctochytrium bullatum]